MPEECLLNDRSTHLSMESNYIPHSQSAKSWEELSTYFSNLNDHGWGQEPMVDLINHIRNSNYASRIHGSVNMLSDLLVSIHNPMEINTETLRIQFDSRKGRWQFTYHSKPDEKVGFERKYDAELGIEKFDQFMEWIKW